MDLKKDYNRLIPKLFWARPRSEFGEHLVTQASNKVWKNIDCVNGFCQEVAKLVFNVSNLLFSQVSMLQTDKQSYNVENLQLRFGSLCATHVLTPLIGFWSIPWEPLE